MNAGCHFCGTTVAELRPYGPGGSLLCFGCMKDSPEREAEAGQNFGTQLEVAEAVSDIGSAILTGDGPNPLTDEDTKQLEGLPWKELS